MTGAFSVKAIIVDVGMSGGVQVILDSYGHAQPPHEVVVDGGSHPLLFLARKMVSEADVVATGGAQQDSRVRALVINHLQRHHLGTEQAVSVT